MEDLQQGIARYQRRYNNQKLATALVGGYLLLLLVPLITVWMARPVTDQPFLTELGKNFALIGLTIMVLQFVLAGRLRWISHFFGLDMVLRFHKAMGVLALLLLLLHPLLVLGGRGEWPLLYRLDVSWPIWLGKIALLLLLVQAATSIFQRRLLTFEKWRRLHNQALIILGLAILHSSVVGGDLRHGAMQALWLFWLVVAVAVYGYHKLYRPRQIRRHPYRVKEINRESHNVRTIVLEPPAGQEPMFFLPGQFHFLKFYRNNSRYDGEEHHFTISSSPTQRNILASTIKESGDFTASLKETKPGDIVHVQGAFGRFSFPLQPLRKDLAFIAGGIGITPVISMLRYMRDTASDHKVVLLYANRTEKDILFAEELALMTESKRPRLRVAHVLTRPTRTWKGEDGLIDQGMIRRYCGIDIRGMEFYLCGPPGMMKMLIRELKELGAMPANIHSERFWF
jgi:predicted ferric reductase